MQAESIQSRTEVIVDPTSGFMEFDLQEEWGYTEFRGMFAELGLAASLFNGYMIQRGGGEVNLSSSPVQIHAYPHSLYIAEPFETQHYYVEIPKKSALFAKVFFKIPPLLQNSDLDGYKPQLQEMTAIDLWVEKQNENGFLVQMIYTFFYEARIQTQNEIYEIKRYQTEVH